MNEIKRLKEIELECLYYLEFEDNYVENKGHNLDIDKLYTDQSIYSDDIIFSSYTPYGIKQIDSWFMDEIIKDESLFSNEILEKMIRRNPHLHNVIKTNLLINLKNK